MGVDTGRVRLTVREALFSLLGAVQDPRAVFSDEEPAPDPILDGDAAMLHRARQVIATLVLDNRRMREEILRLRTQEGAQ